MKNLFLSLVLVLTISFSFASNEMEKVTTVDAQDTSELAISNFDQTLDVNCLFELTWDTDEFGTGSIWVNCEDTDDGSFDWNDFLDTILANFFGK